MTVNIGAVVVARMNSSRLPGKSMADILGAPSLEHLLRRLARSRRVERIVVATTTGPLDDPIEALALGMGHLCHRGSQEDVLGRVCGAARLGGFEHVVHVTGDCPLIDHRLADRLVERYLEHGADYAILDPDFFPDGFDVEVFSAKALYDVDARHADPWIREHVTEPLYTTPGRYKAIRLAPDDGLHYPAVKLSIDAPEDLAAVRRIFSALYPRDPDFSIDDVFALLARDPDIVESSRFETWRKYRAGVVGLGNVGFRYDELPGQPFAVNTHAKAFLTHGSTRLAGAADKDDAARRAFADRYAVPAVTSSLDELFAAGPLDIVSIAASPESHFALAAKAVAGGAKAVICEKPFTASSAQAKALCALCAEKGVVLAVNHWMRFSRLYRALKEHIASGAMGSVQSARVHCCKGLMNSGTHAVDLLRFLFGEVRGVRGAVARPVAGGLVNVDAVLVMESGLPAHLSSSDYADRFFFELDVIGARARVRIEDDVVSYSVFGENGRQDCDPPFDGALGEPFVCLVNEVVECLQGKRSGVACSGEDGLRAVQIAEALLESAREGGKAVTAQSA